MAKHIVDTRYSTIRETVQQRITFIGTACSVNAILGFKPIPECTTFDSRVSDQGRICDFIY